MDSAIRIVYIVTVPESAFAFLRAQFRALKANGYEVSLISSPGPKLDALQREHSEDFLARAEAELKGGPVPYTKTVLSGPIGPTIAQHAEKAGCDLIIMGSHGKTTIGDLLVGSVAMKVLHATKLPVMLVK